MAVLDSNEIFFSTFEPHVANRFIFYIDGIPSYIVKKTSMPNFEAGEIVLDHINVYRKLKGKVRWGDLSLELYSPIAPSGQQAVMEWMRLSHESVTGRDGYSDFYKKDISLNLLGPVGDIVGEWIIKGAWVKSSNFGELDWSNDQNISIQMVITMDYCVLNF